MRFGCRKKDKGSLTVEACIALPVFLSFFFLLLFFTKIACLNIVLDHAVKESARQIASMSYPLEFLNGYVDNKVAAGSPLDEFFQNQSAAVGTIVEKSWDESLLTTVFTGKFQKPDLEEIWGNIETKITDDFYNLVEGVIFKTLLGPYLDLKGSGQYYLVKKILEEQLQNSPVNLGNLSVTFVELPQGTTEYEYKKDGIWYSDLLLKPDRDFSKEDVVIQAKYDAALPMPFLGIKHVQLCYTAVERAWLHGGNGIYAAAGDEEGIDFDRYNRYKLTGEERDKLKNQVEYVYLCRSATEVYHPYRHCKYIVDKSGVRKVSLEEAKNMGLRVHGGCPVLFK